jgi:hypothetical protein
MPERTTEDRLREEYFELLPEIRRVLLQLEAEIRFHTLPILRTLTSYEQLVVKSRIKDCESTVNALRRRQEYRKFDSAKSSEYSVLHLPDLAGVRILVFPRSKLVEVDRILRGQFPGWSSNPVPGEEGTELAPKYSGLCQDVSSRVKAEYQIVPMLIGLFWEVEHSAMYKPTPSLKGIGDSGQMRGLKADVERSLSRFEEEFEKFVADNATS